MRSLPAPGESRPLDAECPQDDAERQIHRLEDGALLDVQLDPGPDVGLRCRVQPLARAAREREGVTVLLEDAGAGEVLAEQPRAGDLQLELLGEPPGGRRSREQPAEDAELLRRPDDAAGGHAVERVRGRQRNEVQADGDPLDTPTQVTAAWIRGRKVDLNDRHKTLYHKYEEKYKQP